MATSSKDEALLRAADLTARQLQQALEIVEEKLGHPRSQENGALVGSVLLAIVENYRHRTQ